MYLGWQQLTKTVAATGTPERLSSVDIWTRGFTLYGLSAARTANVGNVWAGPVSTDNTQPVLIMPNDAVVFPVPNGDYVNLKDIYIDVANANDGVVCTYYPLP